MQSLLVSFAIYLALGFLCVQYALMYPTDQYILMYTNWSNINTDIRKLISKNYNLLHIASYGTSLSVAPLSTGPSSHSYCICHWYCHDNLFMYAISAYFKSWFYHVSRMIPKAVRFCLLDWHGWRIGWDCCSCSKFKKLADFLLLFDCGSEQVLIIMSSLIFVLCVT